MTCCEWNNEKQKCNVELYILVASAIIWQASSVEIVDIINAGLPSCVSKVWVRHVMCVYTSIFKGFTEIRYNEAKTTLMQYLQSPLGKGRIWTIHAILRSSTRGEDRVHTSLIPPWGKELWLEKLPLSAMTFLQILLSPSFPILSALFA